MIDNYWQTESGWPILTIANGIEPAPSKLGSPGVPMPGYDVRLVDEATGRDITEPSLKGVVAIAGPTPPGFMQTVWRDDERFVETYWKSIPGRMIYSTFDWGIRDADGYFFILGRTDDVINVAGHRLGTREIEESISSHPNVAEVAVVGVADELKGQVAIAFVVARDASRLDDANERLRLEGDIMKTVAAGLGALGAAGARPLRRGAAEDAQRQAAAPRDPGDLRGPRPGRPDDDRGRLGAAGRARCRRRGLSPENRSSSQGGGRAGGPRVASTAPRLCFPPMFPFATRRPGLAAFLLVAVFAASAAAAKPRIEKAADLPRFTYPIDGQVEDVARSSERFASFAAALRRNTESVLADYDIDDKATQIDLIGLLATLDYLDGRYDSALQRVARIRALQDKPAEKLVAGMRLKAMALAARADGPSGEAFRRDVGARLRSELEPLPYTLVGNIVRESKEGAELASEALVVGRLREVVQPIVDRNGALSSDVAPAIVSARFALLGVLPLKATLTAAYSDYLAAHRVAKADIWAARDVTLTPAETRGPVVIGIWDSGVDTALFAKQLVRDDGKPAVLAYDKYSRPASGALMPLPASAAGRIAELTGRIKGFSDLQSNIDSPEASDLKAYLSGLTAERYRPTIEEINLAGDYVHGTHVAGIALAGNPAARLVVGRIEFSYTLKPDPCPSEELAQRDAQESRAFVDFFKAHHARVVNMSWGGSVGAIESDLEQCGLGKTPEERKALARHYFEIQKESLTRAFASAPGILFVTAAGNSNDDASFVESVPSGIVLPNLLTVGAVDSAGEEASFTSYGPTVKVDANGYQVESSFPGGARVALSGTSMAAPEVTNLAGKLFAVDPKLTPEAAIGLIVRTADASADGRRHLVDPKKAVAAATK